MMGLPWRALCWNDSMTKTTGGTVPLSTAISACVISISLIVSFWGGLARCHLRLSRTRLENWSPSGPVRSRGKLFLYSAG